MSDSLSNFFSHLKSAQQGRILVIEHARTRVIVSILDILQEDGYIRGYRFKTDNPNLIEILLKYKNQKPAINQILRLSKPSRRIYFSADRLDQLNASSGRGSFFFMQGLFILSTSKGIMSRSAALKLNVGGELLCHIF
jgi:small subunit ribosomal protein S8